jgi:ABC-type uncharacterized transport system auxiliary subunit
MRQVWPLLLAVLLGACAGPPPPADTFYRLQVPAEAALDPKPLPGVLEVSRFAAEGLTGERALLYSYRDRPDQVMRYRYHIWTDTPPVLLQDQLVRTLRQARAADQVVTSDLNVSPAFVIQGRLRRFEQLAGTPPAVVVEADIGLVRVHGSELLLLNSYRVETPAASDQPGDAVAALQAATGDLFSRFLADLARLPVAP